ncbi:carbonic anhydrase [Reichenbachiella agarivorans]|uniref:carbonic anhydrase n=1 Tax=Reichenbachiella agarivorans TaxID=2979464 RepID=A0ABY6CUC4_9BACT|nr:carbonic anhydrase [Reichenbachiella agarivorans]UXP31845.1 carbonic anhydrase [Reichenbachiella agarivorans]
MNSQEALTRLKEGNKRFVSGTPNISLQNQEAREPLTKGQSPYAIILSCADSRVAPELAFDAGLGELFVLRVAGNVANTSTIASIEYAVANLGTKLIISMGHESCGAVGAAVAGGDNGPNLNKLVSYIQPSVDKLGKDAPLADIIKENANHSITTLMNQSEIIKNAVKNEGLELVSGYYSLATGEVEFGF